MVIEATHCFGTPVQDQSGHRHGSVDFLVVNGKEAKVTGFQVVQNAVIKKFAGLDWKDITAISRRHFQIKNSSVLQKNLQPFDTIYRTYGRVMGVTAKTESGKKIGRISDLLIDADTGLIIRFAIRSLFQERIIPRRFLVSVNPREIVFQDVVDTPVFDKVAASPAVEVAPTA